ncbi:MAG: hypothetical protein AAF919_05060 [Pseudomonadota bacterium]
MSFFLYRGHRRHVLPVIAALTFPVMAGAVLAQGTAGNSCAILKPGEGSVVFPGAREIIAIAEACSADANPPDLVPGDPCDIRNMYDLERGVAKEGGADLMQRCFERTLASAEETRRRATPLHAALSEGRPMDEIADVLSQDPAWIATPDNRGYLPLHYALEIYDTPHAVRLLLEGGADPNAFAEDAPRPLAHGIAQGAPGAALLALIAAGAEPVLRSESTSGPGQQADFVAPVAAARAGYGPDDVMALLEAVDTLTQDDRYDLLVWTAREGQPDTFLRLFDETDVPQQAGQWAGSALYWYLQKAEQDARVVERLARAADLGAGISTGDTFLDIALKNDAPDEVIAVLAANGAFAHMRGPDGYGLLFAIRDLSDPGLIPVIVEQGFDIDATVEARLGDRTVTRTALTSAFEAQENAGAKIEAILQAGFDPRRTCEGTCSPLHMLPILRFDASMFRWMVALGLDPTGRDAWGDTILHAAARGRNDVMLPTLLRYGVDIDAVNSSGATALWLAYVEIVLGEGDKTRANAVFAGLLEAGADPNVPGPQGKTLLEDMARRGPSALGLAPILRRHGAE